MIRNVLLLFLLACPVLSWAGLYATSTQRAVDWLESQQDASDGSWGSTPVLKQLHTVAAVRALQAVNRRSAAYYAGLAWVKNHEAGSHDYLARRALVLAETGAVLTQDLALLLAGQRASPPGNKGWGLTPAYNGSPLDTALVLSAIKASGASVDVSGALAYLKNSQLTGTDKGWSVSQDTKSDPTTTAQIIIALTQYLATDATLATPLANAANTLATQVTDASPVQLRALAAQALLMRDSASSVGKNLLTGLIEQQGVSGAWQSDVYATASVLQAMAVAEGLDLAAQRLRVNMPDGKLREAVNLALGRGALDHLNRGELAQLITLDISNRGVTSLNGLQYATNLTSLNAANNAITDTSPIAGLTSLTFADLSGNPCPGCSTLVASSEGEVPMPAWALVLLGSFLVGVMVRQSRR
jgi:hypothetical protein